VALTKDEIIEDVKVLLFELRKRYDIKEAYLFGSYARGNPKECSDVDIALVLGSFRDGSPFDETFEIFHEVQRHNSLLEVVCLREEEFSKGDTTLSRHIKSEGIRIL
jgi:predicted nucleotidyltransferase